MINTQRPPLVLLLLMIFGVWQSGMASPRKDTPPARAVIHFGQDSYQLDRAAKLILIPHARYLLSHPDVQVILEGHTDERGDQAYNIARSEMTAQAVAHRLMQLGVPDNRIRVVSWGEERPIASGHNEQSWRLNRRVELVYPRK